MDRAVLVQSQTETDEADLLIYLGQTDGPLKLVATKPGLVWSVDAPGMSASLQVSPRGSLLVRSGNAAVGRNRWSQTLTLAWRDGTFVLAGYSHSARDTLVAGSESSCDVNLLTGKGIKDNTPFRTSAERRSLEDWSDTDVPLECR